MLRTIWDFVISMPEQPAFIHRGFFVPFRRICPTVQVKLNSLTDGRVDVLCRCAINSFFASRRVRRDTSLRAVLAGPGASTESSSSSAAPPRPRPVSLDVVGSQLRFMRPDERSVACSLRAVLNADSALADEHAATRSLVSLGWSLAADRSKAQSPDASTSVLDAVVESFHAWRATLPGARHRQIIFVLTHLADRVLCPQTIADAHASGTESIGFVLGDDGGFPDGFLEAISGPADVVPVALPIPSAILTSQCIAVLHFMIDQLDYSRGLRGAPFWDRHKPASFGS